MDVQQVCKYNHVATAVTTVAQTGPCILHNITVNTKGTGATVTIYDNTAASGTVVGVIDAENNTGTFTYDVACTTGLTVVTVGTADITISSSQTR